MKEDAMSPALAARFADYAAFHGTPGNKACHYVAVPLIVLTLFALLAQVELATVGGFTLTLAEVLIVLATAYYLTLDPPLALLMLAVSVVLAGAGRFLPPGVALALFAAAWVLQFVGHYVYEHRSPAFFKNLTHLLVGPLWVLAKATGRA
jgi:uncharacterized membrane protein YGL010W